MGHHRPRGIRRREPLTPSRKIHTAPPGARTAQERKAPITDTDPQAKRSTELIDEETALLYLEQNKGNRPVRAGAVQKLAHDMLHGNWHQTTSAIGFRSDGTLTDGQHRLHAVLAANKQARKLNMDPIAVPMDVVHGIPEESMAYIDRGIKRTTGDEFSRHGISNPTLVAAAARLLWRYQHEQWSRDLTVGDDVLLDFFQHEHPQLAKAMAAGNRFAKEVPITPTVATVCLYLSRKADLTGTGLSHADWEGKVIDGLEFSSSEDPARQLRRQIVNRKLNNIKTDQRTHVVLYAKAFRAWVRQDTVRAFKAPQDSDPVPSIEHPKRTVSRKK